MEKYNLTPEEQTKLRAICKVTNLSFYAMAARPKKAKELIDTYKDYWGKSGEIR